MTGRRSFTGGAANPRQPRSSLRDAAEHLRLTAGRFLRGTASASDVLEACRIFEQANAAALRLREEWPDG